MNLHNMFLYVIHVDKFLLGVTAVMGFSQRSLKVSENGDSALLVVFSATQDGDKAREHQPSPSLH